MKRILIVEDEPVIANVYKNKFARAGFLVDIAKDGAEGMEKIATWQPDLVLLDIMLPKVNGLDLLRAIRNQIATRALPIIVYSNEFTVSAADTARKLGASHLMSKSTTRPNQVLDFAAALLQTKLPPSEQLPAQEREHYMNGARQTIGDMRNLVGECLRQNNSAFLVDLRHKTRVLGALSWLAGLQRVARLAEGLEALLRTLCENPKYITFSTDKTVLQTVECLAELMDSIEVAQAPIKSPSVLVIDDQDIALNAAELALKKARLPARTMKDSEQALKLLEQLSFDLVLLDIHMPKIDGMTLCTYMRVIPHHKHTPVVFFSQLSEIGARIDSTKAGGNDFIGKPFLTIELAVKALTWIAKPKVA